MDRKEVNKTLDEYWEECPAYIIDWIRDNSWNMTSYLVQLNKI